MRVFPVLVVSLVAPAVGPALALAPCPESCHIRQGQPLLLADAGMLLMTRCDRVAGKGDTCVTERINLEGRVLGQLPRLPRGVGIDSDFTRTYLDGHKLVQLAWQDAWKTLSKPYSLSAVSTDQQLTLSLAKSTLACMAPGRATVFRDFGCIPRDVHVFATMGEEVLARRPVVVVGVCQPNPHIKREIVVVCTASESKK